MENFRGIELQAIHGAEGLPEYESVPSLDDSRNKSLGDLMARVLDNAPHLTHIIPDDQDRRMVVSWFFQSVAIPACTRYGEIYTNKSVDAAALWISPRRPVTFKRILLSGMRATPIRLDLQSFRRCLNVAVLIDKVRQELTRAPHWYLLGLGVQHSNDVDVIGPALLQPVLSRADSHQLPCYAEAFVERDLSFYERLGFRIEGAGKISMKGPTFWAMIRAPK